MSNPIQRFDSDQLDNFPDLTVIWAVNYLKDGARISDSEHILWKEEGAWNSNDLPYWMSYEHDHYPYVWHGRACLPDGTVIYP